VPREAPQLPPQTIPLNEKLLILTLSISEVPKPLETEHGNDRWEPIITDMELSVEGCPPLRTMMTLH